MNQLEPVGDCQPDDFGGAHRVGREQLPVGQHMVNMCRRVHDEIDRVGQAPPRCLVKSEHQLPDVSRDDLEMIAGQGSEALQQCRVRACATSAPPNYPRG